MSSISGKRVAILVADHYNDLEFWYPKIRIKEAGGEVLVAGPEKGKACSSKYGMPAVPDKDFDELRADDVSAVVVPGGYAPDIIRRHQAALGLVKGVFNQGKPVAFICHAGWVLASAGVLKGKRCTSFFAIKDDMVNAGAIWEDAPVVVDGNLISSRTPDDLPQFCQALLEKLS